MLIFFNYSYTNKWVINSNKFRTALNIGKKSFTRNSEMG